MGTSLWAEQNVLRLLPVHDAIYQGTNGGSATAFPGPCRTPSYCTPSARKPARRRPTYTQSYCADGDDYLVVASKGGDPKAPGWYHNLKANPNVEINVGPKRFAVTAHR